MCISGSQYVLGVGKVTTVYFHSTTGKATGGIECSSIDQVIDINRVRYFHHRTSCNYNCPTAGDHETYLDGTNIICSNENYIRQACSGKHSCNLRNIPGLSQPDLSCGEGRDRASSIRISFYCSLKGQ